MAISAGLVKELREKTSVGMMECKKALEENDGDIEKSIKWLREKGIAKAGSKAGRTAAEGMVEVALSEDGHTGVLVEVNCETDFAARNQDFISFVKKIGEIALAGNFGDLESFMQAKIDGDTTLEVALKALIAKVGENMTVRRYQRLYSSSGAVCGYSHLGGKIGTLVVLDGVSNTNEKVMELGKEIAMHVAAAAPKYLRNSEVPVQDIEAEKDIAKVKLTEEGKAPELVEKILMGHVNKYFKDICLLDQPYTRDPKFSIEKLVKDSGTGATLKAFARFQLGEGIEKKESNFAEEVAAQIKS